MVRPVLADVSFLMSTRPWCACHADLLPVLLAIQVLFSAGAAPDGDRGKAAIFAAIVYGPILFVTVLIQQLGHGLAARSVGGEATTVVLWPLGGMTYCGHDRGVTSCRHLVWRTCQLCHDSACACCCMQALSLSRLVHKARMNHQVALAGEKVDIFVQAAGPLTHIPQAGIWLALSILTWHSKSGDWGLHLGSDSVGYHSNKSWNFAQAIMVTAVWVRTAHDELLPRM
jgi:hypothetical protein